MAGPGVCVTRGTHGLQCKPSMPSSEDDLRNLLQLSGDVPATQVMFDAAAEIRKLRADEPEVELLVAAVAPKRRGRPPGSRNRPPTDA